MSGNYTLFGLHTTCALSLRIRSFFVVEWSSGTYICSLSTPKIMTSLQSDAPPEKRRSYLIRGPCRYAFGRLECPCTEGARALDIDSLSGLSDALCEICEHSLDVHNDYRGYVPISDLHHWQVFPEGPRITNPNETIPSLRAKPYGESVDPEHIFISLTVHRAPLRDRISSVICQWVDRSGASVSVDIDSGYPCQRKDNDQETNS